MTFAAIFSVVVGILIIGQWILHISIKQVPEFRTRPVEIAFHLAGEFLTAIALIAGGIGLLFDTDWGVEGYLIATGMLTYTVMVSPGYFAQKNEWRIVVMFAGILVLAMIGLGMVLAEEL